jgi:PleD family two-component response regulator
MIIVDRIQKEYAAMENYGTSLSIGIAMYQPGMSADQIAQTADQALYKAKGLGKNNCCIA